jgi:hypothetical protein
MKFTTHNSQIAVRRLDQLPGSCTGRRAWLLNFQ